jgi:signal transduction histidine kinase
VFSNLVANAIKFTPSGKVTVRVAAADRKQLLVEVQDTGVGIPEGSLERIWNPFEQADATVSRRFGGTGLGLAIVRAFLDRLGGKVAVQSTIGQGTTFTVALPIAGAQEGESHA